MVTQGDVVPENQRAPGRPERGEGRAAELPQESPPLAEGFQKCPYLAGRPPCGTHHLFPSGTNVCWAEGGENKSYRKISRETQREHCFGVPNGCDCYQRAQAAARPLPRFAARLAAAPPRADRVGPAPAPRPDSRAHWWRRALWLLPLCLTGLLLLFLLR